ncbi:MAG: molybdopterin converting factor small subunit [Flavobacteriales bacterium]|jgi:molybdopterin converting factor small subunit
MNITVKYFGMAAETTGKNLEVISTEAKNLKEAKQLLLTLYPSLKGITFQIALNQSFAEDSTSLNDNDELALLPPFAGG